jgi:glycosyltransferase involved in cell wall biosynthesis
MRILLVTSYFPPQNSAGSTRTYAFARFWSKASHQVTVLTTVKRPDQRGFEASFDGFEVAAIPYSIPRFLRGVRARHMATHGSANGIPAAGLHGLLEQLKNRTGIFCSDRMPDITDFWIRPALIWVRSHNQRWDVVVSSGPPYTAHLVACAVKRNGRASRWAADFRDPWTRHHAFTGLFPFTVVERLLERRCLEQADLITTVSDGFAELFAAQARAQTAVVFNGYEPEAFSSLPPSRIFPEDGRVRLVYTGTIYQQGQDPAPLLRALLQLANTEATSAHRIQIVVASLYERRWLDMAREIGVGEFIEHVGNIPREDAMRMQRDADALVLLDWNDPAAGVLPTKVFEYLQVAPPIFAVGGSQNSPIGRLLQQTGRGVHLGSDVGHIAELLRLLADRKLDLNLVRNEQELNTFSREHQAMRYLQMLEHIAPSDHSAISSLNQ